MSFELIKELALPLSLAPETEKRIYKISQIFELGLMGVRGASTQSKE